LDEVTNADLILNVCDFSDKNVDNHIQVTESLLAEMKVTAPIIRVYNKIDADDGFFTQDFCEEFAFLSAKTGKNIDLLVEKIKSYVLDRYKYATYKCSYEQYNQFVKLANNYAVKVVDSKFDEYCTIEILVDVRFVDVFSNQFELTKIR
jgi:50S ribosomal subunit-associated GTPase HflX